MTSNAHTMARIYRVKPGDTASSLAKKFYGDAKHAHVIAKNNHPLPDILPIGMRLKILAPAPTASGHNSEGLQGVTLEEVPVDASTLSTDQLALILNPNYNAATGAAAVASSGGQTGTAVATITAWYKDWRLWATLGIGAVGLYIFLGDSKRK